MSFFRRVILLACMYVCFAYAQDSPAAIVRKAVAAMGGMETAAKWAGAAIFTMKGTVSMGGEAFPGVSETRYQPPDRIRTVLTTQTNGASETVIDVFNGKTAWRRERDETAELDTPRRTQMMHGLHSLRVETLVPLITDPAFQLSSIPAVRVDGRDAVGVRVSSRSQEDIDLFFDKESGLLVKSERMAMDPDRDDVRREDFFRNYRESGGGKRWTRVAIFEEGKKLLEMDVVRAQCMDHIPDSEFLKP